MSLPSIFVSEQLRMKRASLFFILMATLMTLVLSLAAPSAHAEKKKRKKAVTALEASASDKPKKSSRKSRLAAANALANTENRDGQAEARLIDIYKLIGQAKTREAMPLAESLVRDHPNFQLAQLVFGDLLTAQLRPVRNLGDVPDTTAKAAAPQLQELRKESK